MTVAAGFRNRVLGNAIYDNNGLGIDLGKNGHTPNDAAPDSDMGANFLQNYPVITSASVSGAQIDVDWTLDTMKSRTVRIEFFGTTCDPSGYGEGRTYLGSVTGTTDNKGHAADTTTVTAPASGELVTATATILGGSTVPIVLVGANSTSEFSKCTTVS